MQQFRGCNHVRAELAGFPLWLSLKAQWSATSAGEAIPGLYGKVRFPALWFDPPAGGGGVGFGEGLPPKNPKNICHHCRYAGRGAGDGWMLACVS